MLMHPKCIYGPGSKGLNPARGANNAAPYLLAGEKGARWSLPVEPPCCRPSASNCGPQECSLRQIPGYAYVCIMDFAILLTQRIYIYL